MTEKQLRNLPKLGALFILEALKFYTTFAFLSASFKLESFELESFRKKITIYVVLFFVKGCLEVMLVSN